MSEHMAMNYNTEPTQETPLDQGAILDRLFELRNELAIDINEDEVGSLLG